MIARAHDLFDLHPERLAADTGFGSAEMLDWLVNEQGIEPHVPVFDKSQRTGGTFSRNGRLHLRPRTQHLCLSRRQALTTSGTLVNDGATMFYRASKADCSACTLKFRCSPNAPMRRVPRSIHEGARDLAGNIAKTAAQPSQYGSAISRHGKVASDGFGVTPAREIVDWQGGWAGPPFPSRSGDP